MSSPKSLADRLSLIPGAYSSFQGIYFWTGQPPIRTPALRPSRRYLGLARLLATSSQASEVFNPRCISSRSLCGSPPSDHCQNLDGASSARFFIGILGMGDRMLQIGTLSARDETRNKRERYGRRPPYSCMIKHRSLFLAF